MLGADFVALSLPPLVIGLCLLILFQTSLGQAVEKAFQSVTHMVWGEKIGMYCLYSETRSSWVPGE